MRILKKVVKWIGIIIVLILVIALFLKKDFSTEKEIVINKPRADVFNYVKYLKNQNDYGVWAKRDPNIKQEYTGIDGTEGFISSWEGNSQVGEGSQMIKKIDQGKRIDFELTFKGFFGSSAPAWFTTEDVSPTQTKVKWGMKGKMTYPFNFLGLFWNMDEMIGEDYQAGLNNMKAIIEK